MDNEPTLAEMRAFYAFHAPPKLSSAAARAVAEQDQVWQYFVNLAGCHRLDEEIAREPWLSPGHVKLCEFGHKFIHRQLCCRADELEAGAGPEEAEAWLLARNAKVRAEIREIQFESAVWTNKTKRRNQVRKLRMSLNRNHHSFGV